MRAQPGAAALLFPRQTVVLVRLAGLFGLIVPIGHHGGPL